MKKYIDKSLSWSMPKTFFVGCLLFLIGTVQVLAGPRDFLQAKEIALEKASSLGTSISEQSMRQTQTRGTTTPQKITPYYIFNFKDSMGYVIVGGDDGMPAIVGYNNKGILNPDSLPSNLKDFLSAYKNTVEAMEKGDTLVKKIVNAAKKRVSGSYTPVSPLLGGIEWSQREPFNNCCPLYDGTNRAATGCVATAMAQIMAYWKYPNKLFDDIPGYTSRSNHILVESIQHGIAYDWDHMLPNYKNEYDKVQENAVAILMFHVGTAVKMDYGNASGAYSEDAVSALTKYFDYDKNFIKYLERATFEWDEWNEILQDELSKKRPIYYTGGDSFAGRHAFVCDGIDADGYYHINWGWGGISNGYFDITILNPDTKGGDIITSNDGYNDGNSIIIGIVPNECNDKQPIYEFEKLFYGNVTKNFLKSTRSSVSEKLSGKISCMLTNYGEKQSSYVSLGIKNAEEKYIPISSEYLIDFESQKSQPLELNFDYAFPVGEKDIYVIQRTNDSETWDKCYGLPIEICVSETEGIWESNRYSYFEDKESTYKIDTFSKVLYLVRTNNKKGNVVIPETVLHEGVYYPVVGIMDNCFMRSTELTGIELPNTLKEIGAWCFLDCKQLTRIELPNKMERIGDYCFYDCENLQEINLPEGITSLPPCCFYGCKSLLEIDIPSSVKKIGYHCFGWCGGLQKVRISNGVEILCDRSFGGCSRLVNIDLPNSIKEIGTYCFCDCNNLENIIIPEGITVLREACFWLCSNLISISLPSTINKLERLCFGQCNNLQSIFCKSDLIIENLDQAFSAPTLKTTLYVHQQFVNQYKSDYENFFKEILPLEGTSIDNVLLRDLKIDVLNGKIILLGLQNGMKVHFYSLDGKCIGEKVVSNGMVTFYSTEPIVIAKIGNKSIKVATLKTL